ncbi:hypothetical protein SAMN05660420_01457 [Desulfuromusa kysingii]|uniref:SMODS and SLOG-associating 2TM effector domain-containing protein n=1 Tax=Desulfuromusa kysingii TaxID=37625 RepID=A0A1H3Z0B0_9BACT|nr:hypothetical protein [Desulfuromusa kysingii]SEA16848.1 hypothetical protein SAMN05660420_01457 [Desulfuromusa kysingii]
MHQEAKPKPVFSILVAGHREDRLNRMNSQEAIFASLKKSLLELKELAKVQLDNAAQLYKQIPSKNCEYRLLTGCAPGVDTKAAQLATEIGYELHLLTPGQDKVTNEAQKNAQRKVTLGAPITQSTELPVEAFAIRDEIALAYSDVLTVVWDGKSPQGIAGGTVRLIRESLLQRKPVIWIGTGGNIKYSQPQQLTESELSILRADGWSPTLLKKHFNGDNTEVMGQLECLLNPAKSANGVEICDQINRLTGVKPCGDPCYGVSAKELKHEDHPIAEPDGIKNAFSIFDTQANAYAKKHRSSVWALYLLATFAVFFAACGALTFTPKSLWPYSELTVLSVVIAIYLIAVKKKWHGLFLSHRYLAEQLRYLRFSYPLLAIPSVFLKSIWKIPEKPLSATSTGKTNPLRISGAEIWLLNRTLISTGLPTAKTANTQNYNLQKCNTSSLAQNYLKKITEGQHDYHVKANHKRHSEHRKLHRFSAGLFIATFIMVVMEIFHIGPHSMLSLGTIVCPALGAAIHGILTQNEIARISAMSNLTAEQLKSYIAAFEKINSKETDMTWNNFLTLRCLTNDAAELMSGQNSQWQALLIHQKESLPA